jgi:hypothetical protein
MNYRYEVAGFSGYVTSLDEMRTRLTHLRDKFNLHGCTARIYRNQCALADIFKHRGEVDKELVL